MVQFSVDYAIEDASFDKTLAFTDKDLIIPEEDEENEDEAEDEFAEEDLPTYEKSYVLSRVTNKEKDDRSKKDSLFAEEDLPTYEKSYVLSRVTNKDKDHRSKKTAIESRMSKMSNHPSLSLKRSVGDEFKLSMIRASLDYDIGNFQGKFENDVRMRQTSKVLSGQEWAVDRKALEKAKMNSMADVLLPPPSPDGMSRRKNAMVLPVPNNLTTSLANLQGLHKASTRSSSPTRSRSTSRLSNAPARDGIFVVDFFDLVLCKASTIV